MNALAHQWRVQHLDVKFVQEKNTQGEYEPKVHATAEYAYKTEQIWDVLKHYENLKYLVPRVLESRVLKHEKPHKAMVYIAIKTPWPWPKLWTVVEVRQTPELHHFEWVQIKGNLKSFQGWAKVKQTSTQVSHFESHMVLHLGHAIPQFVHRWAIRYYIPKVLLELGNKFEKVE